MGTEERLNRAGVRQLEEEKQRLELEVERRLQAERLRIREATQKEEEQSYLLKLAEKEKVISDMKKQVEELRRKSEQLLSSSRARFSNWNWKPCCALPSPRT